MTTVRAGAVHWTRGAVVTLLAALIVLVVLVHHETVAITSAPLRHAASSPHTGQAMPGTASSSAAALPHGFAHAHADSLDAPTPAHGVDGSACANPGPQHCTAAGVDTVKLAPPQRHGRQTAHPYQARPGRSPAGTISRAPPDLSVLSQLRI
ncbi:hypothetical protein RB628_40415 [Streptomyces sp. ADMS]|uniref:hypothetical protein n=1 Tax=Streptomyces sp. ADMS TaxID=3071415 RepID=UPI00296E49D5|nr:hypothetical protein [Streptomyces sp. ADMS]MDW4911387.1 hypothetical protein [Streptomyces sp. ADMS]